MLSRRRFLALLASGIAAESLLPYCSPALRAEFQEIEVHLKKRVTSTNKSYGSGNFGEWISDAHGLPCFQYTSNQTEDPFAVTPVETAWRSPTDHTHQIGNDRITAAASNYGYIQVRQDEGGAKFLNDYQPEAGLFGAGLGYLTDGQEVIGTYFPGTGVSFDRFFGMGYLRKQITGTNYSVDQTIYAPFGDDPVLISEVVISSQNPRPMNLYWAEYWGCQPYPLWYDAFVEGHAGGALDPVDAERVVKLRREAANRFQHGFRRLAEGPALVEAKALQARPVLSPGIAVQEESAGDLSGLLARGSNQTRSASGAGEGLPPETFLASLDAGPVRFLTDAAAFFGPMNAFRHTGAAGPESVPVPAALLRPAGLAQAAPANAETSGAHPDDLSATGAESALILLKPFTLDSGQSQTLRFLYGYLPEGFSAATLIAKYRVKAPTLLEESSASWKSEGIQFSVKEDPWVERETRWHHYYLRSGCSFDDFFQEHILSQGQTYQYCMGAQAAARDPLQHLLPLIFSAAPGDASLPKEVLRYALKSQAANGGLPYGVAGHGEVISAPTPPSDLDLWLLWAASEYVLATRDSAFLEERLASYPLKAGSGTHGVRELLARSFRHLLETVGIGEHGLLHGGEADWNDQVYRRGVPGNLAEEVGRQSESVMNSAMAAYILNRYAAMLRYAPGADSEAMAKDAVTRAAQQQAAVRAQWAGRWFKRAWLGAGAGWVGADDRMWLDGQPWAILGGCATAEQEKALASSIDDLLRRPSKIGAKQVSRKIDWPGFMPGESMNGGVWAQLGGTLTWALAAMDPAVAPGMAYDEWKKNSRAHHAEVYPNTWYGAWSGPDVYCSADSDHAGQTGYDWGLVDPEARRRPNNYRGLSWTAWPVMNMHRHAWPLYSAAKLMGIEFTEKGIDLAPVVPKPEYGFRSRLAGLERTPQGYEGWYAPHKAGAWTVRLRLPAGDWALSRLTVNDSIQPAVIGAGNILEFTGSSSLDRPLRWSLRKNGG